MVMMVTASITRRPRQDLEIFSINSEFDYQITGSSLYQKTTINYKMDIPADLQERAKQQTSIKLPVTLEVVLRKGSNIIDLNVHVDNQGFITSFMHLI